MSLSFARQLDNFVQMVHARERALFQRIDEHVGRSIRTGSPITGAPGQPVRSGALLGSWHRTGSFESRVTSWTSELPYAPIIEHNLRGAQLRSTVGGFHSVKLTRHGFQAIVRHELGIVKSQIKGSGGPVFKGGAWRDARGRYAKAPT